MLAMYINIVTMVFDLFSQILDTDTTGQAVLMEAYYVAVH